MEPNSDLIDLLHALNAAGAEYLIIGGYAVAHQAWANRVPTTYGGVPVNFIGKTDLIANKEAAGRPQDVLDVENLRSKD
jgi:hypothetical protein